MLREGQPAAVIDSRMGQKDEVYRAGLEWERAIVQLAHRFGALEEAAVDEEAALGVLDRVAGPGYDARSAVESQARRQAQLPSSASAGSRP
jgi:hypothetical protein